jgi:hypothetical protein
MSTQDQVIVDILAAREAANKNGNGANDLEWTENDWIAFVNAYLGRASQGVYRNEKEKQSYRDNLVKAGGLIVSALVAYDRKFGRVMPGTVAQRATA